MGETNSRIRSATTIVFAVVLTTAGAACNDTSKASDNDLWPQLPETPTINTVAPAGLPARPPEPQLPDHNYDERRGWTYYYIAAVSEEDQKRGRAVGTVYGFQYLGRNADGEHIIASINTNGTVSSRYKCSPACRIIDADDGEKIAYSTRSIIGAAFQDAFRGKLRVAEWAKYEVAPAPAAPAVANGVGPASPTEPGPEKAAGTSEPSDGQPATGGSNGETQSELPGE